jgi:hypothetical protein
MVNAQLDERGSENRLGENAGLGPSWRLAMQVISPLPFIEERRPSKALHALKMALAVSYTDVRAEPLPAFLATLVRKLEAQEAETRKKARRPARQARRVERVHPHLVCEPAASLL